MARKTDREDTRYYDEIFKKIKSKENPEFNNENDEENDILYDNIIDQLKTDEKEVRLCLKSQFIDYFIYNSKSKHLNDLLKLFFNKNQINEFLFDINISRAIETCLLCVGGKLEEVKNNVELLNELKESLKELGDFFVDKFKEVLSDLYAIYPLRTYIRICGSFNDDFDNKQLLEHKSTSNITSLKKKKKFFHGTDNDDDDTNVERFRVKITNVKVLPLEFKLSKYLKKFCNLMLDCPNILEMALVPHVSPCLTVLMRKIKSIEKYEEFSNGFIESIDNKLRSKQNSFQAMIQDAIGSRFIEIFLYCASNDAKLFYLNEFIVPNIVKFTRHIYANYPIQTLLKSIKSQDEELKILYEEILSNIEEIIDLHSHQTFKHFLLIELIETCKRNSYSEKKLMKTLRKFFGCNEDDKRIDFLRFLLIFEKYEDATKDCSSKELLYMFDVKPIACTISTKLIENKFDEILECLNDLNSNEIEHLSTNNIGSHFIQDCLNCFYKNKQLDQIDLLFKKIKGRFLNICCNKSGSFVMETLWSMASIQQKVDMCEELKDNEADLRRDQYARFFANKTGISFFKRKQSEWIQIQKSEMKKREMFSELYNDLNDEDEAKKSSQNRNGFNNKRKNNQSNGFNKNKRKNY